MDEEQVFGLSVQGASKLVPRLLADSGDSCHTARVILPSDSASVCVVIQRASCLNAINMGKRTRPGTTCTRVLEVEVGMRGCRFWWVPAFGRQYLCKDFSFLFKSFSLKIKKSKTNPNHLLILFWF